MSYFDEKFINKTITPDSFVAFIEISKGSKNKYEIDHETGCLNLDRILYTSTHYPQNYGFIPRTLADDGDPLDCLVLCSEQIISGATVQCKPLGMVRMIDGGSKDYKIICVPFSDPFYNMYESIDQLPKHLLDEIEHFFTVYKSLEGKTPLIKDIKGISEAKEVIGKCLEAYQNTL